MNKHKVKAFLNEKPGYQKWGVEKLAIMLNSDRETVRQVLEEINRKNEITELKEYYTPIQSTLTEYEQFLEWRRQQKSCQSTNTKIQQSPNPYIEGNINNILIIGDLHEPFCLDGYLEFCRNQQEKYNCGTVVFIGDLVDGHSWSYHETDVDGQGQNEEIRKAKEKLKRWYHTFPTAKCTLGNHDLLVTRKAKTHGLSQQFIKSFNEIWEAPKTWEFGYEFIIDNVRYTHGDLGSAIKIAKESRISTVQGHLHTESYIQWSVSEKDRIFGLQVGCGIDHKRYAFEYAKPLAKKPIIACAVILDSGTQPISIPMQL